MTSDSRTDIISRRARSLLADELSQWTLREIEREFEEVGIANVPDPDFQGAQRRTLVAGYYYTLDFTKPADARKFVDVATLIVTERERRWNLETGYQAPWSDPLKPPGEHPMARFIGEMKRCGYEWVDGRFVGFTNSARLADAKAFAEVLDLAHLGEHVARIERAIETDPRQAIGSAKEMVETVCKTILGRRGIPHAKDDTLMELGKATFRALKQLPDDVPETAKGAKTIRVLLNNLSTVVQGLAELRSSYGTGHGQHGKAKGLEGRHARLAVGAAATLTTYMLETDRDTPLPSPSEAASDTEPVADANRPRRAAGPG